MPRVNVWIRKEDEDKWNAISNKSEFVHAAINGNVVNTDFIVTGTTLANNRTLLNRTVNTQTLALSVPSKCLKCNKYACECK